MTTKTYPDSKPFHEKTRLVILDLDCFLYPYDKTYRNAVLRAWRAIEKEYGLPIFRRKVAQKLIAELKEKANRIRTTHYAGISASWRDAWKARGFPVPR